MKFSMYTNFGRLVRELGFEGALKKAKSIGFSGVEITEPFIADTKHAMAYLEDLFK